jgi:hypothetical protein
LEDGQRNFDGVHSERRRHDISATPSPSTPDSPSRTSASNPDTSGLCLVGRESSSRRSVSFHDSLRLGSPSHVLPPNNSALDSTGDRPICVSEIGSNPPILRLGRSPGRGGPGRTRATMDILPGLRFPSSGPSPSRHSEDRRFIRRLPPSDALLACPEMVSGDSRPPSLGCSTSSTETGSDRSHNRPPAPSHSSSSSRLEDYRRLRGIPVSDNAFRLISGSWRPSTATRYDAI